MNYKSIETLLRKCQKRLRLADWNIQLSIVGPEVFSDSRVAECRHSFRNMEAFIRVLDPKYIDAKMLGFDDIECTLYHELLHIIIDPIVGDRVDDDDHEQVIEKIAKALANI